MSGSNVTGPKFLTTAQVAAILGVHVDTVRKMIGQGRIKAVNVGSKGRPAYRVPSSAVLDLGDCDDTPPPAPTVREFV
jgi:excisionase family DNA binding protein